MDNIHNAMHGARADLGVARHLPTGRLPCVGQCIIPLALIRFADCSDDVTLLMCMANGSSGTLAMASTTTGTS